MGRRSALALPSLMLGHHGRGGDGAGHGGRPVRVSSGRSPVPLNSLTLASEARHSEAKCPLTPHLWQAQRSGFGCLSRHQGSGLGCLTRGSTSSPSCRCCCCVGCCVGSDVPPPCARAPPSDSSDDGVGGGDLFLHRRLLRRQQLQHMRRRRRGPVSPPSAPAQTAAPAHATAGRRRCRWREPRPAPAPPSSPRVGASPPTEAFSSQLPPASSAPVATHWSYSISQWWIAGEAGQGSGSSPRQLT